MPPIARTIRVFVASPSDVATERTLLLGVINELNTAAAAFAPDIPTTIELVRWETHVSPGMGRPQGVVNAQIGDIDIFIGIMWRHFGTPTGLAESGTEEELRHALNSWRSTGRPHIMFYFSNAPSPPPRTPQEVDQLNKVVRFRAELRQAGLTWEYPDPSAFTDVVRSHLTSVVGRLLRPSANASGQQGSVEPQGASMSGHVPPVTRKPNEPLISQQPSGRKVITEISKHDAYFPQRNRIVGRVVFPISVTENGGWLRGTVEFDTSQPQDLARRFTLYKFKWRNA